MTQENLKSNLTKNSPTSNESIVYLYPEAYLKIIYHSLTYSNRLRDKNHWLEVMGWLSGEVKRDSSDIFELVHIKRAWPISHGDAVSVKIEDYGKTLEKMMVKVSKYNETILGWYHSHPAFGLFMSQTDYETQLSYQRLYDKAVALVFDHTLWSTINSGLEAYRLLPDYRNFEKIPIIIAHNYQLKFNQPLNRLFMKKIIAKNYLDELDTTND